MRIGHRKKGPNFASNAHIRAIIEGHLFFALRQKAAKYEIRISKYETSTNELNRKFKTSQYGWTGAGAAEVGLKAMARSLDSAPVLSCESTGASLGMTCGVRGD